MNQLKLLPNENIRPIPCGTKIKAFHPQTLGVAHIAKIKASWSPKGKPGIKECRYDIVFDVTPKKKFTITTEDILAMEHPKNSGVFVWRESLVDEVTKEAN